MTTPAETAIASIVEGTRTYFRVTGTWPNRFETAPAILALLNMDDAALAVLILERAKALGPTLRAGDRVKHGPTGETWVLATDEEDHKVFACGWPETRAEVSDCTVVTMATDDERRKMLANVATSGGMRGACAARQVKP